jgi:NAD(P)-dependent dehydrogenase (short-subunit alcohol dehydrogenase family)
VRSLAQRALQRRGDLDAWINNVGVVAMGAFERTPIEAHRRVIETNLLGHIHGAHVALTHSAAGAGAF